MPEGFRHCTDFRGQPGMFLGAGFVPSRTLSAMFSMRGFVFNRLGLHRFWLPAWEDGCDHSKGRFWLRRARRWLLPVECASLQGIVYTKELTGGKLCELAGNAQVSTHTMAAIIATNTYSGPPGRQ